MGFNISENSDRITQKPDVGTLTFLQPKEEDEGHYTCFAENDDGIAISSSFALKRGFLGNFINDSVVETMEAVEGEPFKLECKAPLGYPTPNMFWMIQTTQGAIKGIDNSRLTLDPSGNLWFSSVTRDDASKDSCYVCSAASPKVNEYKLGNRVTLKVNPRAHKSFIPPTLQFVSPSTIFALRGKSVEIFCIYHGSPSPKIAWSKGGNPIEFGKRLVSENSGRSLMINKVEAADEGEYACNVLSENGENESSNFIFKVEAPPQFIVEPDSKNVTINETIEMMCEADGTPPPKVEWLFNGKLVGVAGEKRYEMSETKFVIKEATKPDTGSHACRATNTHGLAYKNIYINVDEL